VFALLAVAVLFVVNGVFFQSDLSIAMKGGAIHLQAAHKAWARDGGPSDIHLEKYTSTNRTYIHTNRYSIDGREYESLFGYDHDYFSQRGELVVSKSGDVIWIDKRGTPKVIRRAMANALSATKPNER